MPPRPAAAGRHFRPEFVLRGKTTGRKAPLFVACASAGRCAPSTRAPRAPVTAGQAAGFAPQTALRKPGERERFDLIRLDPERRRRNQRDAALLAFGQRRHQRRSCALRRRMRRRRAPERTTAQWHRRCARSELGQRALHISAVTASIPPDIVSSQTCENSSRPVLFGGGSARNGSASSRASKAWSTVRSRQTHRCRSKGSVRMLRGARHRAARCPGRSRSQALAAAHAGRNVTLLMPPMLTMARGRSAAKTTAWNAGTSGAPWPPAARSRLRKSATTSI